MLMCMERPDGLEEVEQQGDRSRAVAEGNIHLQLESTPRGQNGQPPATYEQMTRDIAQLNEDKQSLQQQVKRQGARGLE